MRSNTVSNVDGIARPAQLITDSPVRGDPTAARFSESDPPLHDTHRPTHGRALSSVEATPITRATRRRATFTAASRRPDPAEHQNPLRRRTRTPWLPARGGQHLAALLPTPLAPTRARRFAVARDQRRQTFADGHLRTPSPTVNTRATTNSASTARPGDSTHPRSAVTAPVRSHLGVPAIPRAGRACAARFLVGLGAHCRRSSGGIEGGLPRARPTSQADVGHGRSVP